ncbi:MAG: hypothetical protein PHX59_04315 [Sulfuricurvum sp.]|nr:hypothetical protein [Sulfuricurvum sp.]
MKTVKSISTVLGAILIVSASAYASPGHDRGYYSPAHHHNEGRYEHRNNGNWVVPLVIGGVLGYVLSEPRQENVRYVSTVQRPIVYASQPMYREQWVYFSDCDCQRKVLVPVR